MIRSVLGSRASIGGVLGSGRGGAAAWYLAGGVSAANCVAAYQPIGAASLSASYTNLANPGTYDAAEGVAPTWAAATGWTFNGSTQYLTTGVVPANNQTWSAIAKFSGASASGGSVVGAMDTLQTRFFVLQPRRSTSTRIGYFNGGLLAPLATISSGVIGFAGTTAYRNGTAESGTIPAGSAGAISALYIGAINQYGMAVLFFDAAIQALAIYSVTLSAAQVAAISSAMASL